MRKRSQNEPKFGPKTKAFSRKGSFTFVFTILQKFTLDWCLLAFLSGAKLITLKGAFLTSKYEKLVFNVHLAFGYSEIYPRLVLPCFSVGERTQIWPKNRWYFACWIF
jgi:hypothetical protein